MLRVYVTTCLERQKAMRLRLHDHYNRAMAFPPFPSSHPSCPALSHGSQDSAETLLWFCH